LCENLRFPAEKQKFGKQRDLLPVDKFRVGSDWGSRALWKLLADQKPEKRLRSGLSTFSRLSLIKNWFLHLHIVSQQPGLRQS
jgi:hypothetical protein